MATAQTDFECGREALSEPRYASLCAGFLAALAELDEFPRPEDYSELVGRLTCAELSPDFVAFDRARVREAGGYEQHVRKYHQVPTRSANWHDLFNLAIWAHWPRTKWALNEIQCACLDGADANNGRAPAQNVAAHFDECGLVVESLDHTVLDDLRAHRFKRALWERRGELAESTRFWVVGHGSLEGLLRPHLGLVGKALLVHADEIPPEASEARQRLDRLVAHRVLCWHEAPPYLHPVPLMGIPGYFAGQCASFYDDKRVFRPLGSRIQAKSQGTNSAPSTSQA